MKTATIDTHIFDRDGWSWCSECHLGIDIENLEALRNVENDLICPGCGAVLEFGETSFSNGGSDF